MTTAIAVAYQYATSLEGWLNHAETSTQRQAIQLAIWCPSEGTQQQIAIGVRRNSACKPL